MTIFPDDQPLRETDRPVATPTLPILPAELHYRLIRRIGQGSFGEVYEAEAPGGVRVAIKRIHRSLDHSATRSELEALEAIKNASHPFLLQTHAYWAFPDQLIIAMELAEASLTDRLAACKQQGLSGVPPEELIPFFLQAAEGLDYLHSQNISHRDVKPHNLLYLKGYAKVADFGLARVQQHTQTTVFEHTGTPLYMAPEAWAKQISLHSDQYSLAATYFTARVGRTLFPADLIYELALQHIQMVPDLRPLPEAEQRVLMKALAKSPEDRFPSCKAFAEALREAVFPPPLPPTPLPPRRLPVLLGILVILLVGLILGGLASRLRPPTPVVAPEKYWSPPGWEPLGEDLVTTSDGRRYYAQLGREVGGDRLTAIAIPPSQPTDPPLFYILRDKVTNRVFRTVWDTPGDKPNVSRFREIHRAQANTLLPGKWREGAFGRDLQPLGIDGTQATVPVVNVTLPEAGLVALELGGMLPTYRQWAKATGAWDDPQRKSTVEPSGDRPAKGLALGLDGGPWPVDRPTRDVSCFGIHQLVSNGYEWTRESFDREPIDLFVPRVTPPPILVVGQTWDLTEVRTFSQITAQQKIKAHPWHEHEKGIGFRIVLEPN